MSNHNEESDMSGAMICNRCKKVVAEELTEPFLILISRPFRREGDLCFPCRDYLRKKVGEEFYAVKDSEDNPAPVKTYHVADPGE